MTRRLGGTGKGALKGLASLSLGVTMSCCLALAGCSDDTSTNTPSGDSGVDGGMMEAGGDAKVDGSGDGAVEAAVDAGGDAKTDGTVSEGGSGPDAQPGVDAGPQCSTPTFSVPAGTITAGTSVTLTASGLPSNGFIFFTTDGSLPTHNSPVVASGGSIVVNQSETIRAIAYADGACTDSSYATVDYTAVAPDGGQPDAGPQCSAVTFSPVAGTVAAGTVVTLSSAGLPTDGSIFYTTDGSMPGHNSPFQASGGTITINQSGTIRAIAYAAGECTDSTYTTATYTVLSTIPDAGPDVVADVTPLPACPTPVLAPAAGTIASGTNIVITATGLPSGGYIFFTTDNTLPGRGSPIYNAGAVGFPLD